METLSSLNLNIPIEPDGCQALQVRMPFKRTEVELQHEYIRRSQPQLQKEDLKVLDLCISKEGDSNNYV